MCAQDSAIMRCKQLIYLCFLTIVRLIRNRSSGRCSRHWQAHRRHRRRHRLTLGERFTGRWDALAATSSDTQVSAQVPQADDTVIHRLVDALFGDRFADTNDHDAMLKANENDCQWLSGPEKRPRSAGPGRSRRGSEPPAKTEADVGPELEIVGLLIGVILCRPQLVLEHLILRRPVAHGEPASTALGC